MVFAALVGAWGRPPFVGARAFALTFAGALLVTCSEDPGCHDDAFACGVQGGKGGVSLLQHAAGAQRAGSAASSEVAARPRQGGARRARPRYVFSASTGHSGTASVSTGESFTGWEEEGIIFNFENYAWRVDGRKGLLADWAEWRKWFDANPTEEMQLQRTKMFKERIDKSLEAGGGTTWVDLGHHTMMGILQHIPEVFGDSALVIRLRRSRLETVKSLISHVPTLCELEMRICPATDANLTVLSPKGEPWTPEGWARLTPEEGYFWWVDEVEAQWQKLLESHPNVPRMECDWEEELEPCLQMVADLLGVQVANAGAGAFTHSWAHATNDSWVPAMAVTDQLCHTKMAYTAAQTELIKATQF